MSSAQDQNALYSRMAAKVGKQTLYHCVVLRLITIKALSTKLIDHRPCLFDQLFLSLATQG